MNFGCSGTEVLGKPLCAPMACHRALTLLPEAVSSGCRAEMGFGSGAGITVQLEEVGVPRDALEQRKSVLASNRDS